VDIHIVSIFPEMFDAVTEYGVVGRTIKQQKLTLSCWNPRNYTEDKHRCVDDRPYGGGPGMVMMAPPIGKAIDAAKAAAIQTGAQLAPKVVYLSPQGRSFDHVAAQRFAEEDSLVLLAGRYEGVDERVLQSHVDEEWSIGDYVLSGGELPAMVMIDAIARLLPDSLGNAESAQQDSFVEGLLDCPHYTRPEVLVENEQNKSAVPDVLLSGDHRAISRWRLKQALGRTWLRRPELIERLQQKNALTELQLTLLAEFKQEFK